MMEKRGYTLNKQEKLIIEGTLNSDVSYNLFKTTYFPKDDKTYLQDSLTRTYEHSSGIPSNRTKVIFVRELSDQKSENILTDTTNAIKDSIKNDPDILNVILIVRVPFRSANYADLKNLVAYNIEIFLHSELFYDPTNHELQPHFEFMSMEDSKKYLSQSKDNYNIKKSCVDDPVIKFMGGKPGQVVAVYRKLAYIAQCEQSMEYRLITKQTITEHAKKTTKKD